MQQQRVMRTNKREREAESHSYQIQHYSACLVLIYPVCGLINIINRQARSEFCAQRRNGLPGVHGPVQIASSYYEEASS